eukprot:c35541_g1_i1 orf=9-215(-)
MQGHMVSGQAIDKEDFTSGNNPLLILNWMRGLRSMPITMKCFSRYEKVTTGRNILGLVRLTQQLTSFY